MKQKGDNAYFVYLADDVHYTITWLFNEVRLLPPNVIQYDYSNVTFVLWIRNVEQNNGGYYECIEQLLRQDLSQEYQPYYLK